MTKYIDQAALHVGHTREACRSCEKSYPAIAHHAFVAKQYEEISDYESAGYTKDEAHDMLDAER